MLHASKSLGNQSKRKEYCFQTAFLKYFGYFITFQKSPHICSCAIQTGPLSGLQLLSGNKTMGKSEFLSGNVPTNSSTILINIISTHKYSVLTAVAARTPQFVVLPLWCEQGRSVLFQLVMPLPQRKFFPNAFQGKVRTMEDLTFHKSLWFSFPAL